MSRVRMLDSATGFDADVVCERWGEPDFIKEDKCRAQYRCCILIHYCAWHWSRVNVLFHWDCRAKRMAKAAWDVFAYVKWNIVQGALFGM